MNTETKIIKLKPHPRYSFMYITDETEPRTVSFNVCTLGKYKGKTFMIERPITNDGQYDCIGYGNVFEVLNELKFHIHANGKTKVPEKMEIFSTAYTYNTIFFSVARKAKFAIEDTQGLDKGFPGYTFNQHWNGWEMPLFEKKVANKIAKASSIKFSDGEEYRCYYDKNKDVYYYKTPDEVDPYIVAEGTTIITEDGNEIKVYDFGLSGWIWEEVKK